ncbi:MAG TPA: alpha/beta hydrolase [Acidimicrobiia bacterium]|jgi:acetyl esterase
MDLLPGLQDAFDSLVSMGTPPEGLSVAQRRAWMHERIDETFTSMGDERPPVASEVDRRIAVEGGEVTARVYRPDAEGALPGYLYLHGGGFWLGTLDQSDSICRGVATDVGCVVVSVDYRLAPEHKFPVAVEDSYAALLWLVDHADELGVDTSRLAVGGGSAGGNLAAVVALMARERSGPPLALQVLEVGVFDFSRPGKEEYVDLYLGGAEHAVDPHASPLLSPDLSGLPPAVVTSAEYDRLRQEDADYAARLREAGVAVEERCWKGQFHGSMALAKLIPDEAREYHEMIVGALRRAYGRD